MVQPLALDQSVNGFYESVLPGTGLERAARLDPLDCLQKAYIAGSEAHLAHVVAYGFSDTLQPSFLSSMLSLGGSVDLPAVAASRHVWDPQHSVDVPAALAFVLELLRVSLCLHEVFLNQLFRILMV